MPFCLRPPLTSCHPITFLSLALSFPHKTKNADGGLQSLTGIIKEWGMNTTAIKYNSIPNDNAYANFLCIVNDSPGGKPTCPAGAGGGSANS